MAYLVLELTKPACNGLNEQIIRLRQQMTMLTMQEEWGNHHLHVIVYFEDGTNKPFTFTKLDVLHPFGDEGHLWISGMVRDGPPVKRAFYNIVKISSEITKRKRVVDSSESN